MKYTCITSDKVFIGKHNSELAIRGFLWLILFLFNVSGLAQPKEKKPLAKLACLKADTLKENVRSVTLSGKVVDADSGYGREGVPTQLRNSDRVLKKSQTNKKGEFSFKNIKPQDYMVIIDEGGGLVSALNESLVKNIKVEVSEQPPYKKHYENIYYDFNEYSLRPESKEVLSELVNYYKKHPGIQIELEGYTDEIGSAEYNKWLGKKRAHAARDYMATNGVNKDDIIINVKGENGPIARNDNPVGRQLNRRVEFYIRGGPGFKTNGMVYITQPGNTLSSIAEQFGMTIRQLKQLNNLKSKQIKRFRPVRVRRNEQNRIISSSTFRLSNADKYVGVYRNDENRPHSTTSLKQSSGRQDEAKYYIVKEGDTWQSIASKHNLSVEKLLNINTLSRDFKPFERMAVKVESP